MIRRRATFALLLCLTLLSNAVSVRAQQTPAAGAGNAIERIRDEGFNRSQLMSTLSYLTDVLGPRLTGSPELRRANVWTRDKMASWGLQNAHLEAWGPFGRGWTLKRFSAEVVEPQAFPLLAYPKAWSPGTNGPLTGEAVYMDANTEEELQKYKGKLRGAIVLVGTLRELRPDFEPRAVRLSDTQLLTYANAPDPALLPPSPPRTLTPEQQAAAQFADRKERFYYEEGAALLVDSSPGGDGGMLQFVQGARVPQAWNIPRTDRIRPSSVNAPKLIPQIGVSNDHYNRIVRMIRQGERVRMSVNLAVQFHDDDLMSYNTVAEIPGTDLKDEVVMMGAHLDSWHTATGATDNAAGVAIVMEAARIIQALKLQPRRTIRVGLWSGEEQGILGSRAYVAAHFGSSAGSAGQSAAGSEEKRRAHEKFSAYYNLDSGTGRVRGVFLQGNRAAHHIFNEWLMPFRDLGASTVTLSNSSGSDHLSFDEAGLPAFDLLQDDVEYWKRTWHSSADNFDRVIPDDLKQAAVVVAALAYNTAMRDERMPRKPRTR